jgi:hypothetical protein
MQTDRRAATTSETNSTARTVAEVHVAKPAAVGVEVHFERQDVTSWNTNTANTIVG